MKPDEDRAADAAVSSWWAKLKERKVGQWCLAYATAAWLLAQVLEVAQGPWGLSDAWVRGSHMFLAAGLPIAGIVAWYHGKRGRQRVSGLEIVAVSVLLLLAGIGARWVAPGTGTPPSAATGEEPRALRGSQPRLAILPFEVQGSERDVFLAQGMSEDLGSRLSGLRGLAVISRSSSARFAALDRTARQFGLELGADYVLEGTVRVEDLGGEGAGLRVTPSLVGVADDTQLWSASFTGSRDDIAYLQEQIAREVVVQLDLALAPAEAETLGQEATSNPLAYEAYLKGVDLLPEGHASEEAYQAARTMFQQAVHLDPSFARAWIGLSDAHVGLYWFGYDPRAMRLDSAYAAIERARSLDPGLPEAAIALGDYYYRLRQFDRALEEFSSVFASRPNDPRIVRQVGFLWRRQGLFEQGLELLEKAIRLDPLDAYLKLEVAWTYLSLRDVERSFELIEQARRADPTEEWLSWIGALAHWYRGEDGDLEAARAQMAAFGDVRSSYAAWFWIRQELFEGNPEAALERIDILVEPVIALQNLYEPTSLLRGTVLLELGRGDEARSELERAVESLEADVGASPDDFRLRFALGAAYAGLGRTDEAIREGQAGADLMPLESDALVGTDALYFLMKVYAAAGEDDLALDTMARLLSVPSPYGGFFFTREPSFSSLRDHRRFWSLLRGAPVSVQGGAVGGS